MKIILSGVRRIRFIIATVIAKIQFGKKLTVSGLFKKRKDTQIIINEGGTIGLKNNVSFQKNVSLTSVGGNLKIGKNVAFNRNCIVICRDSISIDDNVIFGPNVVIYDHDHIFTDQGIQPGYRHGSVVIEKGCWIAANVTILRNTHIGEGCVIGAGCIIKGNIPAHSLVTSGRDIHIEQIKKREAL